MIFVGVKAPSAQVLHLPLVVRIVFNGPFIACDDMQHLLEHLLTGPLNFADPPLGLDGEQSCRLLLSRWLP